MIEENGLVSHYSRIKYLENILAYGMIILGPVKHLDDPRESSLNWIQTVGLGSDIDKISKKNAEKIKKDFGKKIRIFCTSQSKPESKEIECQIERSIYGRPRMWA